MSLAPDSADHKATVLAILDENREMAVSTCRPDGWPHVTLVGYVHDDLTLYFAIGRDSQKAENIERDPRIGIALGRRADKRLRGLSAAARAFPVRDPEEIDRLNALIHDHYPEQRLFAPRTASSSIIRALPKIISLVDLQDSPGPPVMLEVSATAILKPYAPPAPSGRAPPGVPPADRG